MKKIFIDAGAHIGQSIELFLNSNIENKQDYEIYSFEAHPLNFEKLKQKYRKNQNINLYNLCVWIKNNDIKFYEKKKFNYNQGNSIIKTKKGLNTKKPLIVQGIDFSSFISDNFSKNDYIILKMDIEGAEYEVLDKMILDRTIEYIDLLLVEFHNNKVGFHRKNDERILDILKEKKIRCITEDMVLDQKKVDWFKLI